MDVTTLPPFVDAVRRDASSLTTSSSIVLDTLYLLDVSTDHEFWSFGKELTCHSSSLSP